MMTPLEQMAEIASRKKSGLLNPYIACHLNLLVGFVEYAKALGSIEAVEAALEAQIFEPNQPWIPGQ